MSIATIIEIAAVIAGIGAALFITAIAMRNWKGDKFLCDDCQFNNPEQCLKVERPQAIDCVAYRRAE